MRTGGVRNELFSIGADLCTVQTTRDRLKKQLSLSQLLCLIMIQCGQNERDVLHLSTTHTYLMTLEPFEHVPESRLLLCSMTGSEATCMSGVSIAARLGAETPSSDLYD